MKFNSTIRRILNDVADTVLKHESLLQSVSYEGVHLTPYDTTTSNEWDMHFWTILCEFHYEDLYFLLVHGGDEAWFVPIIPVVH